MSRRIIAAMVVAALTVVVVAATTMAAPRRNFVTPLSGAEEVPVRDTMAHGVAIFQLSADGESLSYRLIASNIDNVIMAHIHIGPAGANGPITVWLYPEDGPPPADAGGGRHNGVLATGTITSDDLIGPLEGGSLADLVDALGSGSAYVNVHTNDGSDPANTGPGDFPGGEIRGQVD